MARRWRIGLIGFLLFTRTLNVKNVWTKPNWRKKAVRLHLIYMKSNRHLACCLGCAYLFMSASLQGRDSMPPYWLSVCCICVWGGVYVCVFVWLCPFLVFRCQDFSALSASCLLFMQRWTHAHNHAPGVELIAWQSNVEYIRRWKQFGVPEWREHHSLILLTDIDFKKVLKHLPHTLPRTL